MRRQRGISNFKAGLLALAVVVVLSYFGFTKTNPFADPYEFTATFRSANNLKKNSPVRIAGVDVGKVIKVEAVKDGSGAAQVTMEMKDKGLPMAGPVLLLTTGSFAGGMAAQVATARR